MVAAMCGGMCGGTCGGAGSGVCHDEAMRGFFAVQLPDDVVEDLDEFVDPRRDATDAAPLQRDRRPPWRWIRPDNWHLTLAFMESVPDARFGELVDLADAWATRHAPLRMRLEGCGAFANPAEASTLWMGVDAEAAVVLGEWSTALRGIANAAGAMPDGTRFVPHVTVARSRRRRAAGRIVQSLDTYESRWFDVEWVTLIESHLGDGPARTPRYEDRALLHLGE